MHAKLFRQLRLFNPLFPPMKLVPDISSSRAVPIFSRVFPFKLKYYAGLSSYCSLRNDQPAPRRFSTRPSRTRAGSSSEFRRVRNRGDVRASKSLIDDEAELSDWVGELGSDSFRGRLASEDDSDGDRGYNSGRSRDRSGDRGRESYAMKRRRSSRESDPDEFGESNERRTRAQNGSFSRNSRTSRRLGGGGGEFDASDGGWSSLQRRSRGSRGEKSNLKANSNSDSFMRKRAAGRNVEMEYNRNRDSSGLREGGNDLRKASRLMDDDDDVEDKEGSKFGIKDLISEEDSDSFQGTDNDDDFVKKNGTSSFGLDDEVGTKIPPRSSPEKSSSYLSETRHGKLHFSLLVLSIKFVADTGVILL